MKCLSVRCPWSAALVLSMLGKDVENRDRHILQGYRGDLAIHAGKTKAPQGTGAVIDAIVGRSGALREAWERWPQAFTLGAIVGVVRLDGVGRKPSSRWAEPDSVHLICSDPRLLVEPIPYRGQIPPFDLPEPIARLVMERARRTT